MRTCAKRTRALFGRASHVPRTTRQLARRQLSPPNAMVCTRTAFCGAVPGNMHTRSLHIVRPMLSGDGGSKGRSIENTYKKMSPIEHVLLRPGMYVGGTKEVGVEAWTYDASEAGSMNRVKLKVIPGLLKVCELSPVIAHVLLTCVASCSMRSW